MPERLIKSEKTFEFIYIHPDTSCFMSGTTRSVPISAINKDSEKAIVENTPVICDGCGRNYILK
jgi:hypothetical protein